MLTANIIGRQFVKLLSDAYGDIKYSIEPQSFLTNQCHVDFIAEPEELNKSLDDWMNMLGASARALADHMKARKAVVCFPLELPAHAKKQRPELFSATHRYNCMSARCLLELLKYDDSVPEPMRGKYIIRFDVLYSTKPEEIAA